MNIFESESLKDLSTYEIIKILSNDTSKIELFSEEILEKVYEDFSNNESFSKIIELIAKRLGIKDNFEELLAEKIRKNDEKVKKNSFKPS